MNDTITRDQQTQHYSADLTCTINNIRRNYYVYYVPQSNRLYIHSSSIGGVTFILTEVPKLSFNKLGLKGEVGGNYKAPMSGKIVAVCVKEKEKVNVGDVLVVMESMKMEHNIRCVQEGIVDTISVNVGQVILHEELLITVKKE